MKWIVYLSLLGMFFWVGYKYVAPIIEKMMKKRRGKGSENFNSGVKWYEMLDWTRFEPAFILRLKDEEAKRYALKFISERKSEGLHGEA